MNRYKYVLEVRKEVAEEGYFDTSIENSSYTFVECDGNFMTILSYMLKDLPTMIETVNREVRK